MAEPQPAALTTTVSTRERLDRPLGEGAGLLRAPAVQRQRTAAALAARDDDVAALHRQHARGRGVDAGEELTLHAAGQHADDGAALTACRDVVRQPHGPGAGRGEAFHRGQGGGDAREQRREVDPGRLVRAERPAQRAEPPGVREDGEDRLTE
jgi:hypothetical protein